jgi:hypothetical protein
MDSDRHMVYFGACTTVLNLVVHPSVTGLDASLASQACTSETAYIQSEIIVGFSPHQWVERIELY